MGGLVNSNGRGGKKEGMLTSATGACNPVLGAAGSSLPPPLVVLFNKSELKLCMDADISSVVPGEVSEITEAEDGVPEVPSCSGPGGCTTSSMDEAKLGLAGGGGSVTVTRGAWGFLEVDLDCNSLVSSSTFISFRICEERVGRRARIV